MPVCVLYAPQISASLLTYKCANTMPRWWAHVGLFAGIIGIINFMVELGRLGSYVAPPMHAVLLSFRVARACR